MHERGEGRTIPWIFILGAAPYPVTGGVQTKVDGLLAYAERAVDVISPVPSAVPRNVRLHVVPQTTERPLRTLTRLQLPSQTRFDVSSICDVVADIAKGSSKCVIHLDTIGAAHLSRALRARLTCDGVDSKVIISLNDSYSFLLAENNQGGVRGRARVAVARAVEKKVLPHGDLVDVVSPTDVGYLAAFAPEVPVRVLPLGTGPAERGSVRPPPDIDVLMFSGSAGTAAFLREGLPRMLERNPYARVVMVGPQPNREVATLVGERHIEYVGFVEDINAQIRRSKAVLAPSQQRCGMSNRAILAMRLGTPVVGGRCLSSLPGSVAGREYLVGNNPATLADALLRVLGDEALQHRLSSNGMHLVDNLATREQVASTYWSTFGEWIAE